MDEKHVMKNMEYWKKKNNIPGIGIAENAGLTGDGRAGSSAFQMKTGDSPNKFLGGLGKKLFGGGAGEIARMNSKNESRGQGGVGSAIGGGFMGAVGANQNMPGEGNGGIGEEIKAEVKEEVKEEVKQDMSGGGPVMMKSPVKKKGDRISNKYGVGDVIGGDFGPFNQEDKEDDPNYQVPIQPAENPDLEITGGSLNEIIFDLEDRIEFLNEKYSEYDRPLYNYEKKAMKVLKDRLKIEYNKRDKKQ